MNRFLISSKWLVSLLLSATLFAPAIASSEPMLMPEEDVMTSTLFASIDASEAWVNKMPTISDKPFVLNQSTTKMQVHLKLNVENLSDQKEQYKVDVYVTSDVAQYPVLKVDNLEVRTPAQWDGVTFPKEALSISLFGTVIEPIETQQVIYTVEIEDSDGNVTYFKSKATPLQYAF